MRYNYTCTGAPRCKVKDLPIELHDKLLVCIGDMDTVEHAAASQGELLTESKPESTEVDPKESFLIWEEEHGMFATVDIKCPVCKSPAVKSYANYYFSGYVRGNGYLDRRGCLRDMNLYKLKKDDPYAEYRVPGEVEDLEQRLKRSGKHNPNRTYFIN